MNRKTFLQTAGLLVAGGAVAKAGAMQRLFAAGTARAPRPATADFPLVDLHVHRSEKQSLDDIAAKSARTGIRFGVMENIAPWGIRDDRQLEEFLDAVEPYPVYVGLQPMSPGWSKNLSPELIARADYVTMDPQAVPAANGYGEDIMVWEYASYVDDPEEFMERNMDHYMNILCGDEPLDIFACPLLLPCCLQRDYYRLWTKRRLCLIIDAAAARGVAIEINDLVRVPHAGFIRAAKRAGLKFAFGSDTRDEKTGRLDYCRRIAAECGLTRDDLFIPSRELRR